MFQLPVVFNNEINEITRYEYVPKRNYISVHCQQQWQTATRLLTANYDCAVVISQSDERVHHRVECLLPQTFN